MKEEHWVFIKEILGSPLRHPALVYTQYILSSVLGSPSPSLSESQVLLPGLIQMLAGFFHRSQHRCNRIIGLSRPCMFSKSGKYISQFCVLVSSQKEKKKDNYNTITNLIGLLMKVKSQNALNCTQRMVSVPEVFIVISFDCYCSNELKHSLCP